MADNAIDVKRASAPAQTQTQAPRATGIDLFQSFQNEIDRMFGQFWRGFGLPGLGGRFAPQPFSSGAVPFGFLAPRVDVSEDEKAYRITAELPGLTEKDVDVTLAGDLLTIAAEKTEEKEEKDRNYHVSERRSGSFRRSFYLPEGVDRDRIEAALKNGELTLTLPKTPEAQAQQKKIEVKGEAK
jgi:HSP20 family protein